MFDIHKIKEIVEERESSITAMILTMKCDSMAQQHILLVCLTRSPTSADQIQQAIKNMSLANGKLACAVLEYIDTQKELTQLIEDIS